MHSTILLACFSAGVASSIASQVSHIHDQLETDVFTAARISPGSYNLTLGVWIKSHYLGVVHQLSDGQLRVGDGSIPIANFTFSPNSKGGGVVDSLGRGCIATPGPAKQFQCDEGVQPGQGFDISCLGRLTYHGSEEFWVCPVDNNGIRNLYVEPIPKQMHCRYVYVNAVWPTAQNLYNRTGCKQSYDSKPWIFVWDKLYNNSNPVHPDSPDGPAQIEGWQKYSNGASVDAVIGKSKGNHSTQSQDGRCGSNTGFDCFGKAEGPCCSAYGWCGLSALHCGTGCQSDFGICDASSSENSRVSTSTSSKGSSKAPTNIVTTHAIPSASPSLKKSLVSPDGRCGGADGYNCIGFSGGPCCSDKGWCGVTNRHCATSEGCQPGFGKCKMLDGEGTSRKPVTSKDLTSEIPKSSVHSDLAYPKAPENTSRPVYVPRPSPHRPQESNSSSLSPLDCSKPSNSQNCGKKFPTSGCPHDLDGDFEFPHLIVPVDKTHPDRALGNQFNGIIDDEHCTLYNFDINPNLAGKKCSLVWLFPEKNNLSHSSFDFSAQSHPPAVMEFWHLRDPASEKTTWSSLGPKRVVAAGPVRPGFSCNAKTIECSPGHKDVFMVCGQNFSLKYFQSSGGNPIGLYIRTC